MSAHWSDVYVGRPYIAGTGDCAALAELVQREVFGRSLQLPAERAPGLRAESAQIEAAKLDHGVPTDAPADGDAVLMFGRGRLRHVGLYCVIDGQAYVLHAMRSARQVTRHALRELPNLGLQVEGFYRWVTH